MRDTLSGREEVLRTLDLLSTRGLGRLYTLKAMASLGRGWHGTSEVFTYVWKTNKYGTNHVFELGIRYPDLVELSKDRKSVRLTDSAFDVVLGRIDACIRNVLVERKGKRAAPT